MTSVLGRRSFTVQPLTMVPAPPTRFSWVPNLLITGHHAEAVAAVAMLTTTIAPAVTPVATRAPTFMGSPLPYDRGPGSPRQDDGCYEQLLHIARMFGAVRYARDDRCKSESLRTAVGSAALIVGWAWGRFRQWPAKMAALRGPGLPGGYLRVAAPRRWPASSRRRSKAAASSLRRGNRVGRRQLPGGRNW